MLIRCLTAGTLAFLVGGSHGQTPVTQDPGAPAVPRDAITAIIEAFQRYPVVCLGDAHGNRLGQAFQIALVQDPRFAATVNDVVIETGNSRYQQVVDRFVNGEEVAEEELQRVWLDTRQQQVASRKVPAVVTTIRRINATRSEGQRLRVLLGEAPIQWERMNTEADLQKWEAEPSSSSEWFGADVIRREVLAKKRKALVLYGAGHFFRKPAKQSVVTLLEAPETPIFTVWTNAAAEMSTLQAGVASWPVPSITLVRGTTLGRAGMSIYLGPKAGDVSPQWLLPMEEQFDAVLYLGPLEKMTFDRPEPWSCSDPALDERLRRLRLQFPAAANRVKQTCVQ